MFWFLIAKIVFGATGEDTSGHFSRFLELYDDESISYILSMNRTFTRSAGEQLFGVVYVFVIFLSDLLYQFGWRFGLPIAFWLWHTASAAWFGLAKPDTSSNRQGGRTQWPKAAGASNGIAL